MLSLKAPIQVHCQRRIEENKNELNGDSQFEHAYLATQQISDEIPAALLISDIHHTIKEDLSCEENVSLGQTCWSFYALQEASCKARLKKTADLNGLTPQQVFFRQPELRRECYLTYDQRGIDFLWEKYKIGGPLTLQKLKNGTATIKEIIDSASKTRRTIKIELHNAALNNRQRLNLRTELVVKYATDGSLPWRRASDLNENQRNFLMNKLVQSFIDHGLLSIDEALELGKNYPLTLSIQIAPWLQSCINNGLVRTQEIFSLYMKHGCNTYHVVFQQYIQQGNITFKQAIELSAEAFLNLCCPEIKRYIDNGLLTFDQATKLSIYLRNSMQHPVFQQHIQNKTFTMEEALCFTDSQCFAMRSDAVKKYLDEGLLTSDQAIGLNWDEVNILKDTWIQKQLNAAQLTIKEVCMLLHDKNSPLTHSGVKKYIENKKIAAKEVFNLNSFSVYALDHEKIQQRIDKGLLTPQEVIALPVAELIALKESVD